MGGPNSNKRQEILINLELRKKKSIVEVRNKRKQIRRTKSSLSINKNKKLGTTENTLNHPNNEGENENCERKTEFVGADESEEDKKEELQNKEHQSSNKSERGSAFSKEITRLINLERELLQIGEQKVKSW